MQIKVNQWDVVEVGRYKEKFQMVLGWTTKEGEFKPYFRKVQDKSFPMSLTFDTDEEAIEFLKKIAAEVG